MLRLRGTALAASLEEFVALSAVQQGRARLGERNACRHMRRDAPPRPTSWRATSARLATSPRVALPVVTRAEVRARHKQRLWTALQSNVAGSAESRLRQVDFSELLEPLAVKRAVAPSQARRRRRNRDSRKSTVVSERVFVALQRGGVGRSSLEVEDLMLFASQVIPLKLFGSNFRRSLCEQAQLTSYQPGDPICAEGERTDAFHVILSGAVEAFRMAPAESASEVGRRRQREKQWLAASVSCDAEETTAPRSLDTLYDDDDDGGEGGEGGGEGGCDQAAAAPTSAALLHRASADGADTDDEAPPSPGDASALPPPPLGTLRVCTYQEGEGFGHAALTTDACADAWTASMRAASLTCCMTITHDMYLEAQRLEEERQDDALEQAGDGGGLQIGKGGDRLRAALAGGGEALLQRLTVALKSDSTVRTSSQLKVIHRMMQATHFFSALETADVDRLSRCVRYQLVHPNTVIMQNGDAADKFYIVLQGALQVSLDGAVLATKVAGDAFGEMALLANSRRTADVIAMKTCDLAVLERDNYLEVVQEKQNATVAQKLQLIRNHPLFASLTEPQRQMLSKCGKLQRFAGGEYVLRQDEPAEEIFIILRGSCAVLRRLAVGGDDGGGGMPRLLELRINELQRGQLFGEVGVMTAAPRSASVVALLPTECLVISRIELMRFCFDCPELKQLLTAAATSFYPSDDELRATWQHDGAWAHYKGELSDAVRRPRPLDPRGDIWDGLGALPRFSLGSARAPVVQGASSGGVDPHSKLYLWASEYLDKHVVEPMKDGLIVSYPKPEPPSDARPDAAARRVLAARSGARKLVGRRVGVDGVGRHR